MLHMASGLNEIKKPIAADLEEFEQKFKLAMKSDTALLNYVTRYIVSRKGKQMRPMFVFFCAHTCGGATPATHVAATLVEILHTATLVHDDVVDDSHMRRGFFSVNALWKNKIAVLVGDYLLAKGLLVSIENDQYRLLQLLSDTIRQMSEGELLQMEKARRLDIKEEVYYEIIRQKTASLIASACASGAASVTSDEQVVGKMKLLGEKIGMAFQIKDDLFDYEEADVGKPRGIDIKERKMTLPLIYTLNHCSDSVRRRIINIVKNENTVPEQVKWVIDRVKESGGMEYAAGVMRKYCEEANALLDEFPQSPYREGIRQLIAYTINRTV